MSKKSNSDPQLNNSNNNGVPPAKMKKLYKVESTEAVDNINETTTTTTTTTKIETSAMLVAGQKSSYSFKKEGFQHSGAVRSGRKWTWKNLKPIALLERAQASPSDSPLLYGSIESPPATKPCKKYGDISGQEAKYTDPETGLYYHNALEYKLIKRLTPDIVQAYVDTRTSHL